MSAHTPKIFILKIITISNFFFIIVCFLCTKSIAGQNLENRSKKVKTKNYLRIATQKYNTNSLEKALHFAKLANLLCNEQYKSLNLCGVINAKLNQPKTGMFYFEKALTKANELGLETDTININLAIINSTNQNLSEVINSYSHVSFVETNTNLLFARGNAYFENGDIANAIEDYKKANSINENKEIYYNLGLAYFNKGDYSNALENLIQAKNKGKKNYEVYLALSIIYQKINNIDLVEKNLIRAYHKNKNNIEVLIGMANLDNKLGRYKSAKRKLNKALLLDKNSYMALCGLGNLNIYFQSYPEAKRKFTSAIKIDPTNKIAYVGMGNLLSNNGNYIEAINYFRQALALDHNNLFAIEGLGIAYFHLNNYDLALENFNFLLSQNPTYKFSYDGLISQGYSNYYLDKVDQAKTNFEEAIKREPKLSSGLNGLGLVYYKMKKYEDAIYFYNKSNKEAPNNDIIYTNRGNAYYKIANYKKAKKDFNKSISLNRFDENAYNGLGISETACGNYANAVLYNEKAVEVTKTPNKDLYMNLIISRGHLIRELYKTDSIKAEEQYNLMLSNNTVALNLGLDPSVANINLGFVNGLIGKYDLANQFFDKITNPSFLMFVQNNKGVIIALNEKSYEKAYDLFASANEINKKSIEENQYGEEYTAPKINIKTMDGELKGVFTSENRGQKGINKNNEKYTSTYFYYDLMRSFPHPTDRKFQVESIPKIPLHTKSTMKYLVYNGDAECYKSKTNKNEIKSKKNRRKNVKEIKIQRRLNCPKF